MLFTLLRIAINELAYRGFKVVVVSGVGVAAQHFPPHQVFEFTCETHSKVLALLARVYCLLLQNLLIAQYASLFGILDALC